MRQAGRYLPEYRAMRERYGFLELARNPAAAAEVTLQPVGRLGVDAAILFADILLIVEPLGVGLEFGVGDGPPSTTYDATVNGAPAKPISGTFPPSARLTSRTVSKTNGTALSTSILPSPAIANSVRTGR